MYLSEIIWEAAADSLKMLPFLYAAFFLMEFIEHKAGDKLAHALEKAGRSNMGGAAAGAALGCVPQCGFSAAASNLYAGGIVGAGTLMAVFISTSDEAIPVLLAHPELIGSVWKLIAAKIVIAIAGGALFGVIMKLIMRHSDKEHFDELCSDCGCGSHGIWFSALKHTAEIFVFILIVNLAMGLIIGFAGEDRVSGFLDGLGILAPFAAALAGLIPNCAASVVITELYAGGGISFGTAVGGLCSGAGVGLAVLFKVNKNLKENLLFVGYLYAVGALSGCIINLIAG